MSMAIIFLTALLSLQASASFHNDLEKRGSCPLHYVTGPGDRCFRFAEDKRTFSEARRQCQLEGAGLANTQSPDVYRFVKQHIEANPRKAKIVYALFHKLSKVFTRWSNGWWIGAERSRYGFKWLDGSASYGHWMQGMPDNGRLFLIHWIKENCLMQMESDHGWNDADCNKKLRYICQKDANNPCAGFRCGKGRCVLNAKEEPFCVCRSGWTGPSCKKPVSRNYCRPNPCVNGGQCFANSQGFHCVCQGEFTGRKCDKKCRYVVTKEGLPENLDFLILLDGSTSVSEINFDKSLNFLTKLINKLDLGENKARVGLIQFSHEVKEIVSFAKSVNLGKQSLIHRIEDLKQLTGGTATGRALEIARAVLRGESRTYSTDTAKYLLVLTDGQSHQENIIRDVVPDIRKMGATIFSVGIGPEVDEAELLLIAGGDKSHVFSVDSFDKLNHDFLLKLIEKMCD